MKNKIITLFITIAVLFCILSVAAAEDNATDTIEEIDLSKYITPVSINSDGVKFSDGYTGFSLSTKDDLKTSDPFTSEKTSYISGNLENYLKLAVIECYRQDCIDDIGKIIASFCDGSYENSNNEIIQSVLDSSESISDKQTVQINNTTEATFDFELLKSEGNTSDYFAYKVQLKKVKNSDKLSAANDDNNTTSAEDKNNSANSAEPVSASSNDTGNVSENGTQNESAAGEKEVINTNKTIINKTNTTIINENNTTIINHNNIKNITKTNETPKNESDDNIILKTVGNPIFLLIVVIVIIAVVAVVMRKRD